MSDKQLRSDVNGEIMNYIHTRSMDVYDREYLVGRYMTGLILSPVGALAIIGDTTHAVEYGLQNSSGVISNDITEAILFGSK